MQAAIPAANGPSGPDSGARRTDAGQRPPSSEAAPSHPGQPAGATACRPPGRKSFAEALYRTLIRLAPGQKGQVAGVFRYLKHVRDLPHARVQHVLIDALGLDLVRTAWLEARREVDGAAAAMPPVLPRSDPAAAAAGTAGQQLAAIAAGNGGRAVPHVRVPSPPPPPVPPVLVIARPLDAGPERDQVGRHRQRPQGHELHQLLLQQQQEDERRVRPRLLERGGTVLWRGGEEVPMDAPTAYARLWPTLQPEAGAGYCPHHHHHHHCPHRCHHGCCHHHHHHHHYVHDGTDDEEGEDEENEEEEQQQQHTEADVGVQTEPQPSQLEQEKADAEYLEEGAPEAFFCPISYALMTDPVVAQDSFTYQRSALMRWIGKTRQDGRCLRSPMTNEPMAPGYTPSHTIKAMVRQYIEDKRAQRQREQHQHHQHHQQQQDDEEAAAAASNDPEAHQ